MGKFIPYEKLSKKEQRERNKLRRGSWGAVNPVTRKPANPKAYNRQKARRWKFDPPERAFFFCAFFIKTSEDHSKTRFFAIAFKYDLAAVLPVLGGTTSPKIVLSTVNGTRTARAHPKIVDCFAFYHLSASPAADSVMYNDMLPLYLGQQL